METETCICGTCGRAYDPDDYPDDELKEIDNICPDCYYSGECLLTDGDEDIDDVDDRDPTDELYEDDLDDEDYSDELDLPDVDDLDDIDDLDESDFEDYCEEQEGDYEV